MSQQQSKPSPGEPRYQRRKEDRPQEIADAAFEVFAEKGYAATRVEEVAKRAGVSKGQPASSSHRSGNRASWLLRLSFFAVASIS